MKKLLALLGSISIVGSSMTVVGFEYANLIKSSLEAKVRNYVNISSLLARATVLSQKSSVPTSDPNHPEKTDGQDFSLRYSSRYLYGKKMNTFFDSSQFEDGNRNILSYFGSMFNLPPRLSDYTYTVKENPDFDVASPTLHLQEDVNTGKTGEDSTINTLSLVSGFLPVILGQDFSATTSAGFLEQLLKIGEDLIKGLIEDGNTFKTIQEVLFGVEENKSLFSKLSESLSEKDLEEYAQENNKTIEVLTFNEVFNLRQVKFWQGLAEILHSGKHANDKPEEIEAWMQEISEAGTGKYAEKVFEGGKEEIEVAFNKILVDGIIRIIPYLKTLLTYIQSFSATALPIDEIKDDNHLFNSSTINGIYIARKLKNDDQIWTYINPDYVLTQNNPKPDIIQWVKTQDPNQPDKWTYHQVINFQDLVQFLQNLLTIDLKTDPNGYRIERILSIFFEVSLTEDQQQDKDTPNPIYDLILEPIIQELIKIFIPDGTGNLIAGFLPMASPVIRASLSHNQTFWREISVPGSQPLFPNVPALLKMISGFVSGDIQDFLLALLDDIEPNGKPEQPKPIYDRPFTNLFNGELLPRIFELLSANKIEIPEKIPSIFKNLATIFTTKLKDVLGAFGLDISTLPIFLYGIKDLSLTDIINTFAEEFKVNLNKILKDNQEFLFNLGALDRVMIALDEKVEIEFKQNEDGSYEIPESIKEVIDVGEDGIAHDVNVVNAVFVAFAYSDSIKDLTINGEKWNTKDNQRIKKYTFLMGNRFKDSSYNFAPGSLFRSISQIYGHDNEEEPKVIQDRNKATLRHILAEFSKLVTWFASKSIPLYVEDTFDPYFDSKLWRTELIKSRNLDDLNQTGILEYFLYYHNPETNETHQYEVKLSRDPATENGDEWVEMGTWKFISINLKK